MGIEMVVEFTVVPTGIIRSEHGYTVIIGLQEARRHERELGGGLKKFIVSHRNLRFFPPRFWFSAFELFFLTISLSLHPHMLITSNKVYVPDGRESSKRRVEMDTPDILLSRHTGHTGSKGTIAKTTSSSHYMTLTASASRPTAT